MLKWTIPAVIVFVALLSVKAAPLAIVAAWVLLAAWQWWYENKYFQNYYYDMREDFFVLKKGVITPRETMLPYDKVQDVYMDQDIFDRLFGLYDVHCSTAGRRSMMEAHIDGVSAENAEKLKEMLLERINAAK